MGWEGVCIIEDPVLKCILLPASQSIIRSSDCCIWSKIIRCIVY